MELNNRLNEVPLASLEDKDLKAIKELENKLRDKYYIIAFDKSKNKGD